MRLDMPTVFGPSLLPDRSTVSAARVAVVSFETDPAAALALLPNGLSLGASPAVSVTRIDYPSVDYLGGRGYAEIVVAVAARYDHPEHPISAGYSPVMWVDQVGALISGREFMGFPKLAGEMSPLVLEAETVCFDCAEFGAPLLTARITDLRPIEESKLERINRVAQEVTTIGWKYIPSASGPPDADYPLANVTRWTYRRAWQGRGEVAFRSPDSIQAPFSARVASALNALPVKAYKPSFVGEGDVVIDRLATRRLDADGGMA